MKSRYIKAALSMVIVLASPALSFAGGQPGKVRTVSKSELQDRAGISRSVNQGKGAGLSRKQAVANGSQNALRPTVRTDTAFSK